MNIFQKIVALLQLRQARKKADEAHSKNGERYYVMPTTDSSRRPKVVVLDRKNFRILKHKGYISAKASVRHLIQECFYFTPYANGDGYIDAKACDIKKRQYLAWYQAMLRLKKAKK